MKPAHTLTLYLILPRIDTRYIPLDYLFEIRGNKNPKFAKTFRMEKSPFWDRKSKTNTISEGDEIRVQLYGGLSAIVQVLQSGVGLRKNNIFVLGKVIKLENMPNNIYQATEMEIAAHLGFAGFVNPEPKTQNRF